MLSVDRASVLVSAALAVASPFAAGLLTRGYNDPRSRGLGYFLVNWPILLIDQLPRNVSSVVMMSGLVPLLLYFGAYLLACLAVRWLWKRRR
jgi:hypothetical protein